MAGWWPTGGTLMLAGLLATTPALAKDKIDGDQPEAIKALLACKAIADDGSRLACTDRGLAALQTAIDRRDVLVASGTEVRQARRSLFGLADLNLFSKGASKAEQEAFTQIETSITQVNGGGGAWAMTLADGTRWAQTDGADMARDPRKGDAIRIRKAPVGGYLANIAGQRAVRVRRLT